jgi:hypothetical protein
MESAVLREAMDLLERGLAGEAEALVARTARDAAMQHGVASARYAQAELDHAHVLVAIGAVERGAEALERASRAREGADADHARVRMTALTQLGEVELARGALDAAERALADGLALREALHGTRHAAYAIGLLPLAELALARGDAATALERAEHAHAIFWHEGHPRVAGSLAVRAEAVKRARGADVPALERLPRLPDALQDEVVEAILARADRGEPKAMLALLEELEATLLAHPRADRDLDVLVSTIVVVAARAGAHGRRQSALRWLIRRAEVVDELADAAKGYLALARAFEDAGELDAAEQAHVDAARAAALLADPVVEAQVARSHGLSLVARGRADDAIAALRVGHAHARRVAVEDPRGVEVLARAELALALGYVRTGRAAGRDAELDGLLADALAKLPPEYPEALVARAELDARREGAAHDYRRTLARALRALIEPELPRGLVAEVSIVVDADGALDVAVKTARAASADEARLLQAVVERATAELEGMMRSLVGGRTPS